MATADDNKDKNEGDAIKVFIRVRPPVAPKENDVDHGACLEVDGDLNAIIMQSKPEPKVFTFDRVADMYTTQETVFSSVAKKIIESCSGGYNGTIFAYGQTGSGKTFTMLGPSEQSDNFQHEMRGVIPRSFEYLFSLILKEQELHGDKVQFLCKCSFLEIYNEQVFDLLDQASTGLQLRENIKKGVFVCGIIEQQVSSAADAYNVLSSGWMNRRVASTAMNRESSRSHAVFTIHIESKENKNGVWNVRMSQLNLVDLAGSERQRDSNATGLRLKEAGNINKSLSCLGNVIMSLIDISHGKKRHVPYRNSKLTFLLRDSLGGNAKTLIIGCVHPGSKCFGETLSTLQFAQRAKMIKNKAVVNEDSHGSVVILQAEIRRLKETLSQYQHGHIPRNPDETDIEVCTKPDEQSDGDPIWKLHFLQAMVFREQIDLQRKPKLNFLLAEARELRFDMNGLSWLQNQLEKNQRLQELCNRKDQSLRQIKMVLKFREEAIKKLEKARKEKLEIGADEKEQLIDDLRGEVRALEEYSTHHPDLARLRVENDNIKAEIRRLRTQVSGNNVDNQKATELEKIFNQLKAEHDNDAEMNPYSTPKPQENESTMAVATLERHKSQITKLQSEIDLLKREHLEEKQQMQKESMEKEAEVVSLRKSKEELEKVLKAHHVRTKIERQTREDLHLETIKTITTPQRAKYHLRNRVILSTNSPVPKYDLDNSLGGEDELITFQEEPPELAEEQTEALTEEIRKLQEESRYLKSQFDERETQLINLVEESSRTDSQKKQLQELYDKEKSEWTTKETTMEETITKISKQLKEFQSINEMMKSENEDLKIVMEASDRKEKEVKKELNNRIEKTDKEVERLETKCLQFENETARLVKELGTVTEEKYALKDLEENLTATLEFTERKVKTVEEKLISTREEKCLLETQLQATQYQLESQEDKYLQLKRRIEKEEGDKETQVLRAMEKVDRYRNELEVAQSQIEAQIGAIKVLQEELRKKEDDIEQLTKADSEKKDAISYLTAKVSELKEGIELKNQNLETLANELTETNDQNVELQSEISKGESKMAQIEETYNQERQRFHQKLEFKILENEDLQQELEEKIKSLDDALQELQEEKDTTEQITKSNDGLKSIVKELEANIAELESNLTKLENDKKDLVRRLEEKSRKLELAEKQQDDTRQQVLEEKETELSEYKTMVDNLTAKINDTESNLENLLKEFDVIAEQQRKAQECCTEFESELEIKKREVRALSECNDEWTAKYAQLSTVHEVCEREWCEKEMTTQQELDSVRYELTRAQADMKAAVNSEVQAHQQLKLLTERTEDLELKMEVVSELEVEKERLMTIVGKHHSEKAVLNSQLEEIKEEKCRLQKQVEESELQRRNLADINAKLVSHQNHQQRIHFHQALKEENNRLQELLKKSNNKVRCLELKLNKSEKVSYSDKPHTMFTPERKGSITKVEPFSLTGSKSQTPRSDRPLESVHKATTPRNIPGKIGLTTVTPGRNPERDSHGKTLTNPITPIRTAVTPGRTAQTVDGKAASINTPIRPAQSGESLGTPGGDQSKTNRALSTERTSNTVPLKENIPPCPDV